MIVLSSLLHRTATFTRLPIELVLTESVGAETRVRAAASRSPERLVTRFIQHAIFRWAEFCWSELQQVECMAKAVLSSTKLQTRYGFDLLEPKLGRKRFNTVRQCFTFLEQGKY